VLLPFAGMLGITALQGRGRGPASTSNRAAQPPAL
jgi:hypothetical protein